MYPIYQDFGKSTRDFFTKGFATGNFKFNLKDNPSKYIKTTITGAHNIEKLEASGDFQYELTCPVMPGLVSTFKWTTTNIVRQEFSIKDLLMCGLTLGMEGQVNTETSSIEGKFKPIYRHPKFTVDTFFSGGDTANLTFGGGFVSGYKNFAGGAQVEVDPNAENPITKSNFAVAYVCGPYSYYSSLADSDVLWAGLVYRYDPTLEFGLTSNFKSTPESTAVFGAAVKYVMDCCTAFKLKVDTDLQLGLGFEAKIRPNAGVTMSLNVDGNKINEAGHTVGLSFDMEC